MNKPITVFFVSSVICILTLLFLALFSLRESERLKKDISNALSERDTLREINKIYKKKETNLKTEVFELEIEVKSLKGENDEKVTRIDDLEKDVWLIAGDLSSCKSRAEGWQSEAEYQRALQLTWRDWAYEARPHFGAMQ